MNKKNNEIEDISLKEFTEKEQILFPRIVDYYIRSEEQEIKQLNLPSGDKDFIPECEERLNVFKMIKKKVQIKFNFS